MHFDHVVLSDAEKAAFTQIVASLLTPPAERTVRPRTATTRARLMAAVVLTSLALAALLAVTPTGDFGLSAWLIWGWGTLAGLALAGGARVRMRPAAQSVQFAGRGAGVATAPPAGTL